MVEFLGCKQIGDKWSIDVPDQLRKEIQKGDFIVFYRDDKNRIYIELMDKQSNANLFKAHLEKEVKSK